LPGDLYSFADQSRGEVSLRLNGRPLEVAVEGGYAVLDRSWKVGDLVELELPMPVRQVLAHPSVQDDQGRVALQRGPLVYCAEWPDNGGTALNLVVPGNAALTSEFRPGAGSDLHADVQMVRGEIQAVQRDDDGMSRVVPHELRAIPYFAWANRGMGEMAVWMARDPEKAWIPPILPPHISQLRTSGGVEKGWTGYNDQNDDLGAVYDGREPLSSADQSHRFFRMRPPVGERAWLEYEFRDPREVSSSRVYWFDDKRFCKLPNSWRLLVRAGDAWVPVEASEPFIVQRDEFSTIAFHPVTTTAVRLEVEPRTVSYQAGEIGPPDAMFLSEGVEWREFGIIEWAVD